MPASTKSAGWAIRSFMSQVQASLILVECSSVVIIALFIAVMLKGGLFAGSVDGQPRAAKSIFGDILIIAIASWIAEVSCIRIYGFYQYDAPWAVFIDVMPAMVVCIWPFVLLSAREVLHRLKLTQAWAVFLMVLYDASLIEPIAVQAKLWSWNEPGLFKVPFIGILGWAFFAWTVLVCLDRLPAKNRWLTILIAPLATHVLLLFTWWGALRWVLRSELQANTAVALGVGAAIVLGVITVKRKEKAGLYVMAPRMAAAALFFVLLGLRGSQLEALVIYGLSFALPYVLATRWAFERFGAHGAERIESQARA
jgi:hypothetical protein